jgi:hypothetical protein
MDNPKGFTLRSLGLAFVVIGFLVLIFVPRIQDNRVVEQFYISGFGETLSETPKEQAAMSFSITIENPAKKNYIIHSVEPIVPEEIQGLLIDKEPVVIKKSKKLKGKNHVEYSGELTLKTIDLSVDAIKNIFPVIQSFKITYNDNEVKIIQYGA